MRLLAWLGQLLCRSEQTPPVEIVTRDYEWQHLAWCVDCKHNTKHTFIEWVEGSERPTTQECQWCGLETEVAREEADTQAEHR